VKHKFSEYLYWILAVVPFLISAAFYSRLPETVAVHWNAAGQPNGYASKTFAAFGLPAIMFGAILLVNLTLRFDPRRQNIDRSPQMKAVSRWGVLIITFVCEFATVFQAIGFSFNMAQLTLPLVGLLFILMGNYLPKCKYNYTMGIRLPWTLASEENWRKTHRFAGKFWILAGVLIAVSGLMKLSWTVLAATAVAVVIPAVYSFLLFCRTNRSDD
jgi:uncharacterized membrane protein